jgi:hypothetical protein
MTRYYRRYRHYRTYRRNSGFRSAGKVVRFTGRTAGRVGMGVLRFGTKAASHILVASVSTLGKIIRTVAKR